ncbi:hypothetical protein SDRG_14760 [Saprolegnia diclina VS20]|uniref:Uncharacterized protein n=1 Tax=Saprolegnia diclina (strain VS20) TaxID=1156394 RepID=T0PYX9_SAPDV|nr:hypothetical protein SDRG_14760 [Saprolegnia diclina VS20]EQC27436.1 hypothetical protein SDRG_14760 [Saprolegnia diclina VS20]|eukprot:XP_008619136.1 hypothetical protein SDRG_14760 [Saprolegnia diclina VS20]
MSSYPSPAHSSLPSLPPHPLYVRPSSFPSTRLVFNAMTPPQTEHALNMSVDEIEDDDNGRLALALFHCM